MTSAVLNSVKECCEDSTPSAVQHLPLPVHLPQLTYSPPPKSFNITQAPKSDSSRVTVRLQSGCALHCPLQLPEAHGAEGTCKIKSRPPEASRFVLMSRLLQCIPRPKEHHQCPSDPQRCARHG